MREILLFARYTLIGLACIDVVVSDWNARL